MSMESAVLSKDVRDQSTNNTEPEDASDDLFWMPADPGTSVAGPLADSRFIL
ncbi:hypothetical protein [Dactylosporangium sp. NPDC051541]|uniref:hypothetical protein n=1 Tax=Dactylosporangium sp. NPDC051541 TaxID=3363977 RepID=UPI0037B43F5B